jgi:chromosome segregation ATPase
MASSSAFLATTLDLLVDETTDSHRKYMTEKAMRLVAVKFAEVEDELETSNQELVNKSDELTNATEMIAKQNDSLNKAERRINDSEAKNAELEEALKTFSQDLVNKSDELTNATEMIAKQEDNMNKAERRINDSEAKNAELEEALKTSSQELVNKAQVQITFLKRINAGLKKDLNIEKARNKDLWADKKKRDLEFTTGLVIKSAHPEAENLKPNNGWKKKGAAIWDELESQKLMRRT